MKGITGLLAAAALAVAAAGCESTAEETTTGGAGKAPAATKPATADNPWKGTGFAVWDVKGDWYVFLDKAKEMEGFLKTSSLAGAVSRPGTGGAKSLKAPNAETLDAFAAWKNGFTIRVGKEGRIWVLKEGSKEAAAYDKSGEPEVGVTRVGAGPGGRTVKAPDAATMEAWAAAK